MSCRFSRAMSRTVFALALWGGSLWGSTAPLSAQSQEVVEIHTQFFYDNLSITGNRLAGGNLIAYVTLTEGPQSQQQNRVVAKYTLDKAALSGDFVVYAQDGQPEALEFYDYRNQPGFDHLEDEVEAHDVRSVTVAALWLWEDHEAQQHAGTSVPELVGCSTCFPNLNGCTGVWDWCNGAYIGGACDNHDNCYQCGAVCNGCTRAQCDEQLRIDIINAGGGPFCARVYWLGVRGLGWLFFQTPSLRPHMGGDVYSLGISINPCPDNMQHLCTTLVM